MPHTFSHAFLRRAPFPLPYHSSFDAFHNSNRPFWVSQQNGGIVIQICFLWYNQKIDTGLDMLSPLSPVHKLYDVAPPTLLSVMA